ncbi:MAG: hypothetical protein AAF490_32650 [Chloroflexota bacterium]
MKRTLFLFLFLMIVGCSQAEPESTVDQAAAAPTAVSIEPTPTATLPPPTATPFVPATYELGTFSKNSVDVTISLAVTAVDQATLISHFAPDEPELHLYSKDLPPSGIQGVGRPTLLLVESGALTISGETSADVATTDHYFPTFDEPFALYPDGPVTLSVPVAIGDGTPETTLNLVYMACSSSGGCKAPVNTTVVFELPQSIFTTQ